MLGDIYFLPGIFVMSTYQVLLFQSMNKMKKLILLPFILLAISSGAQITKIEHFFVSSPRAEKLFHFFRDRFGLPVVWPYQQWTGFASGGLSLGNVVFEFVVYDGVNETGFTGIALEPRQHLEEFIQELDKKSIAHDSIQNNTHVNTSGILVGWSTLGLPGMLPAEANLFICDYKNREAVLKTRDKASDSLKLNQGGPLGILALKEIVISSHDPVKHAATLALLPGVKKDQQLFSFFSGPSIRLKKKGNPGINKIIIKVGSLDIAKRYLVAQNLLGKVSKKKICLDQKQIDGLQVELVE